MTLINGQPGDCLPIQDRGLHYGDGVFETIAVMDGKPLCWDEHINRLSVGCRRLSLDCPAPEVLLAEARALCSNPGRYVLKIILTRGQGSRGYTHPIPAHPTRIMACYPWPEWPGENRAQGIIVRYCQTRLGMNSSLAGIKHLNRLEQVLARNEWHDPAIAEGLMLDIQDNVIEGTMSNLFLITGKKLLTPDLGYCGVAGIIRHCILAFAPGLGLHTEIKSIKQHDLSAADEIFLCNSVIGVWPVRRLGEQEYPPGAWTARIRESLLGQGMIVE